LSADLVRSADLVGQEVALRAFGAALLADRVAAAYLLYGQQGVGRTLGAELFAAALLCDRPSAADPCGDCASCHLNAAGTHGDLLCVSGAAGPFFKDDSDASRAPAQRFLAAAWRAGRRSTRRALPVRTIRRMQDLLGLMAVAGGRKVVVIDAMDDVEEAGAASLLKVLEEPPGGTTFLLLAESPDGILDTILSRCQRVRFRPLGPDAVRGIVLDHGGAEAAALDPAELDLLVRVGQGSAGRALEALSAGVHRAPFEATTALLSGGISDGGDGAVGWVLAAGRDLASQRARLGQLIALLLVLLRDQAAGSGSSAALDAALGPARAALESTQANVGPELIVRSLWVRLERALKGLVGSPWAG